MDRFYHLILLAQENLGGGAVDGGAGVAGGGAAAAGGAAGGKPPGCMGGGPESMIFLVGMLVVFYFLLIRPQQKQAKKHKALIGGLKRGDSVITSSGIYGRIVAIDGNVITLEIAKNTRIKILRNYVGGIANPDTENQLSQTPRPA